MKEEPLVPVGPWPAGIDNVSQEMDVSADALRAATNVDLDRQGAPRRRPGRTLRMGLLDGHSGWSGGGLCLLQDGGTLVSVDTNQWTGKTLVSGLNPNRLMAYTVAGRDVFWTNGETRGRIRIGVNNPWGLPVPGQPAVTALPSGGMTAGRYQLALTFEVLSGVMGGEESGAIQAQVFSVAEGGGYRLSGIPQRAGCGVNVYLSKPNGGQLRFVKQVTSGVTTVDVGALLYGEALDSQFLTAPPAGHGLLTYNGVIYIAADHLLHWTEPQSYGWYRPAANFQPFPSRVILLGETEGGFYVSADRVYFVSGVASDELSLRDVSDDVAVEGATQWLSAKLFPKVEYNGMAPVWFTDKGAVMGLPEGQIVPLQEGRVAVDGYARGAALYREREGIRQMLFALQGRQSTSGFAASDYSTLEIRKGGVAK